MEAVRVCEKEKKKRTIMLSISFLATFYLLRTIKMGMQIENVKLVPVE
jgi:hypothetical protein